LSFDFDVRPDSSSHLHASCRYFWITGGNHAED
jgi:hypothetical protein